MPVTQCKNGKWRIGSGECQYETKEKAMEVWTAILASGQYGKTNINGKANNRENLIRETEEGESKKESK